MIIPVTFRESDHTYWTGEPGQSREYPGMTRVLGDTGYYVIPRQAKEFHRQRGQAVHKGSQIVVSPDWKDWDLSTIDPRIRGSLIGFSKFVATFGFEVEACEQLVWSHEYSFAGRLDYRGLITKTEYKGKRVLIDLKNGDPPAGVELQMAGYAYCARNNYAAEIDECWAVWLRNDKEDYQRLPSTHPAAESLALHAATEWHWKKDNGLL